MAINYIIGKDVYNELGVLQGVTAKYYRVYEFHYYPEDQKSIAKVYGYIDLNHFNSYGKNSYCSKHEFSWSVSKGDIVPTNKSEVESTIITMNGWTDGSIS